MTILGRVNPTDEAPPPSWSSTFRLTPTYLYAMLGPLVVLASLLLMFPGSILAIALDSVATDLGLRAGMQVVDVHLLFAAAGLMIGLVVASTCLIGWRVARLRASRPSRFVTAVAAILCVFLFAWVAYLLAL